MCKAMRGAGSMKCLFYNNTITMSRKGYMTDADGEGLLYPCFGNV